MSRTTLKYNPQIFDVDSIQDAKNIILTPEAGMKTNERWEKETEYLSKDISDFFNSLNTDSIVIDYGCGIGRVSKEIIKNIGCKVIGVDISSSMREMAKEYVDSKKFQAISPKEFHKMVVDGLRVDGAISIWVLQHSIKPLQDILLIKESLKKGGLFYVLNNKISAVPTNKGWIDNKIDIYALLNEHFTILEDSCLPDSVAKEKLKTATFIAKLSNS
jgi:ubiquinone/menaquinone biosynthesis C-methylase UbiE